MSLATDLGLTGGERVVLAGDSITDAHRYSHYLIAWFHLQYPALDLHVQEAARGGTSSSGWGTPAPPVSAPTQNQYERLVYPLSPDVVFVMLGHNDGSDTTAHSDDTQDLIDDWIDGVSGATPVLLGAHPTESTDGKLVIGDFNDNYETIALAATPDYLFSKTWDELVTEWIASYNSIDPASYLQGADSVHPGASGHICIAYAILKQLGVVSAENVVSAATVNATGPSLTSATDCAVSALSANAFDGVDFDRLDDRLPWAIDESGRSLATQLMTEIVGWQSYALTVSNLSAGSYEVFCDGELIGTKTDVELAAGWNMADVTQGPVWEQCQEVLGLVRDMQGVNRSTLVRSGPPFSGMEAYESQGTASYQNGGERGATYFSSMASKVSDLAALDSAIHTEATPVTRSWSVRKIGGGTPVSYKGPGRVGGRLLGTL